MDSLQSEGLWKLMSEYNFEVENPCFNKELLCVICERLIIDACKCFCECNYCYKCISNYLGDEEKYCPGGNTKCNDERILKSDVTRDRRINNRIAKVNVKCPHRSCSAKVELTNMAEHLRLCSKQSSHCPYNTIGCDNDEEDKDTIIAHLNSETLAHSELLIEWIQNLKNEMNGMKVTYESSKLEMKKESETKDSRINALEQELKQLKNEISLRESVESEIVMREAPLVGQSPGITIVKDISTNSNASFVWKIEECSKKRAASVYSDSFSYYEYKFCLCMFIYGDSIGLQCVIMKGENDEKLAWPMKYEVTLSILDQMTMAAHKTDTFQYNTYNNKSAFDRPVTDRTQFIGANPFILYSAISNKSSIVANDSLVVSCVVTDPQSSS